MISREFRSIYEISKWLWGGYLASLTTGNSRLSLNQFYNRIGEVISDIARYFFVFAQEICSFCCNDYKTSASQSTLIGIRFLFSPAIACSGAQAMVFSLHLTTLNSRTINNQKS